jgi:holliday junction DNA helicase RuvB
MVVGPPASAKTIFLTSLMQLKNSYFSDGANSTKAGMIDYVLEKRPRYLLIDEIDKMSSKDHIFLLNLMETGIISETKYGKTRSAQIKTSVFATSNNIERLSAPLRSRFFIVKLGLYTYEQFFEITKQLLSHQVVVVLDRCVSTLGYTTSNVYPPLKYIGPACISTRCTRDRLLWF